MGHSGPFPWAADSTSYPRRLGTLPECPRARTAVLGDARSSPKARGVNQHSWLTPDWVGGPAVSTCYPAPLGPGSDGPRVPPDILRVSGPGPKASGFYQLSRMTGARVRRTLVSTSVPGDSQLGPSAPRIDQRSRATRAPALRPAVSTKSLGRLGFGSVVPRSTRCPGQLGPVPEFPWD